MYAIATLVMNGAEYVPGAVCLAKSIRQFHKDIDLICMITEEVPRDELQKWYTKIVIVDPICVQAPEIGGRRATTIYSWISRAPTKWHILLFEEYEKVLFMDADMICVGSLDDLFHLKCPAAVFDHLIAQEYCQDPRWTGRLEEGKTTGFINWYKLSLGLETKYASHGHLSHGTPIPSLAIENLLVHSNNLFALQGGLVLVEPNKRYHEEFILEALNIVNSLYKPIKDTYVRTDRTLSAIDELLICLFLYMKGHQWTHIDITYNVAAYHLYAIYKNHPHYVIHYISSYKPWSIRSDGLLERDYLNLAARDTNRNPAYLLHAAICNKWWDIYNS